MSVSQAQSCINSAEFCEWRAYNNIRHFTTDKTERLLSIICSVLTNALSKKGRKYFPDDFLLGPKNPIKKATPQDIEIKLKAIFPNGNN